jgi:hypothetical protein
MRVNLLRINNNGTGWEEWLLLAQNHLAHGSELIYSYKRGMRDPTFANVSCHTFVARVHFPNGLFYRQIAHDEFMDEERADNHHIWDPAKAF